MRKMCKRELLELAETLQCDGICGPKVTDFTVDVKEQRVICNGCDCPVELVGPDLLEVPGLAKDLKDLGFKL